MASSNTKKRRMHKYKVGDVVEADSGNPEGYPFYKNIIQQCVITRVPTRKRDKGLYKIALTGFDDASCSLCFRTIFTSS